MSHIDSDAVVENKGASDPAAVSHSCELAVTSRNKFVWPGIDAIIEAYACHVEGKENCQCLGERIKSY